MPKKVLVIVSNAHIIGPHKRRTGKNGIKFATTPIPVAIYAEILGSDRSRTQT